MHSWVTRRRGLLLCCIVLLCLYSRPRCIVDNCKGSSRALEEMHGSKGELCVEPGWTLWYGV